MKIRVESELARIVGVDRFASLSAVAFGTSRTASGRAGSTGLAIVLGDNDTRGDTTSHYQEAKNAANDLEGYFNTRVQSA